MNSDENMMDAYNLAVCFGPSVIDIPNHANPVMCQANINNVIKVFLHHSIPAFHVPTH
jgi:SLIT-ROBO Rho GTPase activating protein